MTYTIEITIIRTFDLIVGEVQEAGICFRKWSFGKVQKGHFSSHSIHFLS